MLLNFTLQYMFHSVSILGWQSGGSSAFLQPWLCIFQTNEEQIDTSWPSGALPRRLACAPDGNNVMLAATSRFGLFHAELVQRTLGQESLWMFMIFMLGSCPVFHWPCWQLQEECCRSKQNSLHHFPLCSCSLQLCASLRWPGGWGLNSGAVQPLGSLSNPN